jgi:MoCo/4Fe-4S cofactor protein with predicted Tat translocation signal
MSGRGDALDLAAIRRRLASAEGRRFWRSLEEAAETPEFAELLAAEFPRQAAPIAGGLDRRQFLRLMSASLALAGLGACTRQPPQDIVPYAKAPEEGVVPGQPLFFATAMPLERGALGLLVESHMGRPTKVEGNPDHPMSGGATDLYAQASVLGLYDPDRSQVITSAGEIRPWGAFVEALGAALETQRAQRGAGLRVLTGTVTSPTLAEQLRSLRAEYPAARWHWHEPLAGASSVTGLRDAFGGTDVDVQHRLEGADVILALDSDFLASGPSSVRDVRAFSARRRPGRHPMNRLYAVEPSPTVTGSKADHRLPLRAGDVEPLARAIAAAVGVRGVAAPAGLEAHARWIAAVARDLVAHRGSSVVLAGDAQPPAVHELVHALNDELGSIGRVVLYTQSLVGYGEPRNSLRELVDDMDAGRVELLLVLESNPVLTAPADFRFAERLAQVPLRIHLGLYDDETSRLCHWHVPAAHYLESWSDVRAYDGTVTIVQPLIAPLYDGRTSHEILDACMAPGGTPRASYDIVREYWQRRYARGDFEAFWRRALHDGVVPHDIAGGLRYVRPTGAAPVREPAAVPSGGGLEITFRPDPTIYDGRFANNGWLQELPKPMTRLTWDNVACLAPATAERLGVASEDVVELRLGERAVRAPVWVTPGHAADAVTVHVGYGRRRAGRVGNGAGFDAYVLRTSDAPWIARGLEVRPTGERWILASVQGHQNMAGRDVVRSATAAEYLADPGIVR